MKFGRKIFLGLVGLYFAIPLVATGVFSLWQGGNRYGFEGYTALFHQDELWTSLALSFELAVETVLASLAILVPAIFWMHLRLPRLKAVFDVISALPFVIPPIVLVAGMSALYTGPEWLVSTPHYLVIPYVVMTLPYTYRTLDVGLGALDIRTLSEAAQSLGAGWGTLVFRVVLPNLTTAIVGAALLTVAIAMGEFTFANILLFKTFAVFIAFIGQSYPTEAAALTLLSFLMTWAAMMGVLLGGRERAEIGGTR